MIGIKSLTLSSENSSEPEKDLSISHKLCYQTVGQILGLGAILPGEHCRKVMDPGSVLSAIGNVSAKIRTWEIMMVVVMMMVTREQPPFS